MVLVTDEPRHGMVCMVFFTHEPRQAAKAYLFNASESPTCFCYLLELALNKLTWFWSPLGASDLTIVRSGPLAPIRHSSHSLSTYPVSTVATLGIWNNCGQNPPLKLPLRSSCIMLWVDARRLSLPDAMERDFNLSLLASLPPSAMVSSIDWFPRLGWWETSHKASKYSV